MLPIATRHVAALHSERVLARARVVLGAASLIAIYIEPTEPSRYAQLAYLLLLWYLVWSILLVLGLAVRKALPPSVPIAIHIVDICWLAVLMSFTGGTASPLFPYFTLTLVASAFRWGFRETIATMWMLSVILFALAFPYAPWSGLLDEPFALNRFVVRVASIVIAGTLLGYLATYQSQVGVESSLVAGLLSRIRSGVRLRDAIAATASDLTAEFNARALAIAVEEEGSGRGTLWLLARGHDRGLRQMSLAPGQSEAYLFPGPSAFVLEKRAAGARISLALDSHGSRLHDPGPPVGLPPQPFTYAFAISLAFPGEWSGRLFLFDVRPHRRGIEALRLLQRVAVTIAPTLHSVYLVSRLRTRAGAAERARLARDLHDTSIQSLIGLEMELHVLRRRTPDPDIRAEIARLHDRLRSQIQDLRRLMEHLHPADAAHQGLTDRLAATLARFQVETGITARFSSSAALTLPAETTHEIMQIVQAALSNVQRHSRASTVDVELARDGDGWRLTIEDDGIGFPSGGAGSARAPRTIQERVAALGGQLTVDTGASGGVRIAICFPRLAVPA